MIKAAKIAISLPHENYEKIERIRRKLGLARSAIFDKAICLWLDKYEKEEMIRQYEDGYKKFPEDMKEIAVMEQLSADAFEGDDWE